MNSFLNVLCTKFIDNLLSDIDSAPADVSSAFSIFTAFTNFRLRLLQRHIQLLES